MTRTGIKKGNRYGCLFLACFLKENLYFLSLPTEDYQLLKLFLRRDIGFRSLSHPLWRMGSARKRYLVASCRRLRDGYLQRQLHRVVRCRLRS